MGLLNQKGTFMPACLHMPVLLPCAALSKWAEAEVTSPLPTMLRSQTNGACVHVCAHGNQGVGVVRGSERIQSFKKP